MILMGKIYTAWKSNAQALGLGKHNHCRCAAQGPGCLRGGRGWSGMGGADAESYMKDPVGGREPWM